MAFKLTHKNSKSANHIMMNFGAFVSPPRRRCPPGQQNQNQNQQQRRTSEAALPMKSLSMKALSECPRQGLPVDLHVTSASVVDGHALYSCALHSVATEKSWVVAYRYSELHAFKNTVAEVLTCDSPKCSGSCQAIRDYMNACFPKKRALFSTSQRVMKNRQQKLENVLLHLLRCVLLPGSAMKCAVARRVLPPHLFNFLGVQHALDRRSLLQIYVDNYQRTLRHGSFSGLSSLSSPSSCSSLPKVPAVVAAVDASCCQCMICLEDVVATAVGDAEDDGDDHGDDRQHRHSFRGPSGSRSSSSCRTSCSSDEMCLGESSRSSCADAASPSVAATTTTAAASTAVVLPCSHVFHRECVFEWLLFEFHCPLCRSRVGPPAVMNFCCAKNRVQWWVGEFDEDPLR